MKKYVRWLLILLFIIVFGVVGWYGIKFGKKSVENTGGGVGEIEYFEKVERMDNGGKAGIFQSVNEYNSTVTYTLMGRFVEEFFQYENGAMYGYFVVEGDTQERKIEINIADNKMNLGLYENSFESEPFRQIVSNDLVTELVKSGKLVLLEQRQEFGEFESASDEYYIEVQEVLGDLVEDIESGRKKYQIPGDFVIAPTFMGVVE